MKKTEKKPKTTHIVEIWYGWKEDLDGERGWSWRIRSRNGNVLVSSTAQLYSRRATAVRVAQNFLKAVVAGTVEVK